MQGKNKNIYSCIYCHRKYVTCAEAEKCKNFHLVPCGVARMTYDRKNRYPSSVLVYFGGGVLTMPIRYYRDSKRCCDEGWTYCGDGKNLPPETDYYDVTLQAIINDEIVCVTKEMCFPQADGCFYPLDEQDGIDVGEKVIAWRHKTEPYKPDAEAVKGGDRE